MTTRPGAGLGAPSLIAAIEAALSAGDFGRAQRLAEQALASGAAHPLPLRLAAGALASRGRFDEAAALLERAIAQAPGDPSLKLDLSRALAAARRPQAALDAVDAALAAAPGFAPAWDGKARLLQEAGDWAGARAAFERAAALDRAAAEPVSGLAALALRAGDLDEARRLAERALALRPDQAEAASTLARTALAERRFEAAEPVLRRLLADPRTPPLARSAYELALGEALHGLKRRAEAFDAWTRGKAILHELYAQRAAGRPGETAKAEALAAALAALPPDLWTRPPAAPADENEGEGEGEGEGEAEVHVFLVGFPRSGTTLLEQALAGHPRVRALEERPTLAAPIDAFLTSGAAGLARLARLRPEEAAAWRRRYWAGVRAQGIDTEGAVFVDKAPAETANLVLMGRLFPRAKVLFAVRDPRDVVLSCLRQGFQMNAMTYEFTTLERAAGCYGAVMASAFAARERLPLDLIEVRHEALVEDFEGGLRRICAHLGLDWRPAMADVAATARARQVGTPSAAQVRQGLNAEGVGGWRAYVDQLAPVLPRLQPWVERFGYG